MVEAKDVVIAVFGATAAASALVLVFLGIIVQAYGSLQNQLKPGFRRAANVSVLSSLIGLACTGLGVWWLTLGQPGRVYLAVIAAFLAQLFLIAIAGGLVMYYAIWNRP